MSDTVTRRVREEWHLNYTNTPEARVKAEDELRAKGCEAFRHMHQYSIDDDREHYVCVGYVLYPEILSG